MIEVVFALLLGVVVGLAFRPARDSLREHFTVVSLEIEAAMAQVVEGGVFNFTVVAKNAAGRVVPGSGIKVNVTQNGGTVDGAPTATVADDGSAGVLTAGIVDGEFLLAANNDKIASAPFPITVTPDNAVASLEVVPA